LKIASHGICRMRDFFYSVGTVLVWRDKFIRAVTEDAIAPVILSGPVTLL